MEQDGNFKYFTGQETMQFAFVPIPMALLRDTRYENPFCVKCYEEGHITMATVVDHIKPHRGDKKLFWDRGNWQPLCEHHHNVKTMTEDRNVEYKF